MLNIEEFITKYTKLQYLDFVPEIRLFLCNNSSVYQYLKQEGIDSFPYWSRAWIGGQALARYIIDNPEYVENRTVIDFASGSGICGIAAKLAGAKRVISIDTCEISLHANKLNARANKVDIETNTFFNNVEYDIIIAGDPGSAYSAIRDKSNIIIGSPLREVFDTTGLETLSSYIIPETFEYIDSNECYIYRKV